MTGIEERCYQVSPVLPGPAPTRFETYQNERIHQTLFIDTRPDHLPLVRWHRHRDQEPDPAQQEQPFGRRMQVPQSLTDSFPHADLTAFPPGSIVQHKDIG